MNDSTHPQRRQADAPPSLDISQMIAGENDPKQRASLIVLHAISLSLEAITNTVRDNNIKLEKHIETFATHAVTEQALMNQGRGMWKIMAWILTGAQLIGIGMWNDTRNTQKESQIDRAALRADIQAGRMADNKIESRLGVLEQTK